jgi:hypothetical protein
MRKLVITFCLAAAALMYVAASTTAQAAYYYGDYWGFGGYGPFQDCNGQRCYIGPPYTYRHYHGHYYAVPGVYYYGQGGGYYHVW